MLIDHTGQAGAIRHALSNALAAFSDDYYQKLDKGYCSTYSHMYDWCGFCSGFVEEGLSQKGKKETGTKEGKKEICLVRPFL